MAACVLPGDRAARRAARPPARASSRPTVAAAQAGHARPVLRRAPGRCTSSPAAATPSSARDGDYLDQGRPLPAAPTSTSTSSGGPGPPTEPFDFDGEFYRSRASFSAVALRRRAAPPDLLRRLVGRGGRGRRPSTPTSTRCGASRWPRRPSRSTRCRRRPPSTAGRPRHLSCPFRPILAATEGEAWERAHRILEQVESGQPAAAPRRRRRERRARSGCWPPPPRATCTTAACSRRWPRRPARAATRPRWSGSAETVAEALLDYYDIGVTTFLHPRLRPVRRRRRLRRAHRSGAGPRRRIFVAVVRLRPSRESRATKRAAAASTPASSPVATRSSSRPRVTASPRRTSAGSAGAVGALVDLVEPAVDGRREQPGERRLALGAPGVALEEQPLERPQLGAAEVGPHGGEGVRRGRRAGRPAWPPGGARPPRRWRAAARRASRSGGAACGGWCRRPRRPRAATARRCRPSANASISASSSSWRRRSSGGRGIPAALAPRSLRLEALGLEVEVAPGQPAHEHADGHAERAALVDALAHERPVGVLRRRPRGWRASWRRATAGARSTSRRARPRSPPTRAWAGGAA